MRRTRITVGFCDTLSLIVCLSVLAILISIFCQPAIAEIELLDKHQMIETAARNWVAIAESQYQRSMFSQAKASLERARQLYPYLDQKQQIQIAELLKKVNSVAGQKLAILAKVRKAKTMSNGRELLQAKAYLEEAVKSRMISESEKSNISVILQNINVRIKEQKRSMTGLYKTSRKHYKKGNYDQAQAGFIEVAKSGLYVPKMGKSAEEYLELIKEKTDEFMFLEKPEKVSPVWAKPNIKKNDEEITESEKPIMIQKEVKAVSEKSANQKIANPERFGNTKNNSNGSNNIKYSYISAVIRDAEVNVVSLTHQGEFDQAKAIVKNTHNIVKKYRFDVDELFYEQSRQKLLAISRLILMREKNQQNL